MNCLQHVCCSGQGAIMSKSCVPHLVHIEGSRPEWCISTIYHASDTPFRSGTLDIMCNMCWTTWYGDSSTIKLDWTKRPFISALLHWMKPSTDKSWSFSIRISHFKGFWPEWYISTIYHIKDIPFQSETLDLFSPPNLCGAKQSVVWWHVFVWCSTAWAVMLWCRNYQR